MDANKIKELRERTNSGFLDCKHALEATNDDLEKAVLWLQEKGIAKADKKATRIAAEGIAKAYVDKNIAILFELNSETDFVANNKLFSEFANKLQYTKAFLLTSLWRWRNYYCLHVSSSFIWAPLPNPLTWLRLKP